MSVHRRCALFFGISAACACIPHVLAQSRPSTLDPDWDVAIEPGVEWCAPVGGESAPALLVCTKDARVDVIDVASGTSRLRETLAVQRGTQFGGSLGAVAYAYGASKVYAFRVQAGDEAATATPGLLWSADAAPSATTEGDPEFMKRLTAAQATPGGVLIVRSDGAVAELRRDDGEVRWRSRVAASGSCDLLASGQTAVVLLKHGRRVDVVFFDLQAETPRAAVVAIDGTPPIWSCLIEGRLLAVWPSCFRMVAVGGVEHLGRFPRTIVPTASTIAVYVSPPAPVGQQHRPALLLAQNADGYACALDLNTWQWDLREADPGLIIDRYEFAPRLRVDGDRIIRSDLRWVVVEDVVTRASLARLRGQGSVLGATMQNEFAYALFSNHRSPEDVRTLLSKADRGDEADREHMLAILTRSGEPQALVLARQILADRLPQRPDPCALRGQTEFELGTAGPVRDTFWLGGKLLLVEDARIRAYTLP